MYFYSLYYLLISFWFLIFLSNYFSFFFPQPIVIVLSRNMLHTTINHHQHSSSNCFGKPARSSLTSKLIPGPATGPIPTGKGGQQIQGRGEGARRANTLGKICKRECWVGPGGEQNPNCFCFEKIQDFDRKTYDFAGDSIWILLEYSMTPTSLQGYERLFEATLWYHKRS